MGDTSGAAANPEKPWERPWSLEEMRQSAGNWSLAGDAGMLLYLQGFSQRMISKTHAAQAQVNGLASDVKLTDIRMQNSFNDFIMLANTQFVENRVYDEDVTQESSSQPETKEEKEKTKEEREAELIPKISHALGLGLQVIDTAFEKLDIDEANSDSEEEDSSPYKMEQLLEPKDPYITRPLPYLIGSQAFFQDDHVGLVDIPSDEEQDDQGTISQSESSESDESGDESDEEEEVTRPTLPRQPVMRSSESESDESGDLFGEAKSENEYSESDKEEEEEEEMFKNRGPANFTDELAAKLGGNRTSITSGQDENDNQPKEKPQKEKKKKSKQKTVEEPDLFSTEPPEDDGDDSPFSKTGGLFSAPSKGLFDDDEEDADAGGLFDDVKKPSVKKAPEPKQVEPQRSQQNVDQTDNRSYAKSGKRLPVGAVSIFGDEDVLFGSKEKDVPTPKASQQASRQVSKPPPKPAGGLFDNSDDEDLFGPPPMNAPAKTAPVSAAKKTVDLFMDDDEDDDDDLFGNQPTIKVTEPPKRTVETQPPPQEVNAPPKKKLPAGAVSIFGGANPLAAALKTQRPPTPEDEESSDEKSLTSTTSSSMGRHPPPLDKEPSPAPSSNSLFAEEPENDLFSKPSTAKSKTKPTVTKGLFEDEEEADLFTPTPSSKPKQAPESKPVGAAKGLFEDEEESDDLFGNLSVPAASHPAKKKPAGGVSIFGDSDIFSSTAKPTPVAAAAPVEKREKSEPVKPKAKRVSLFDDEEDGGGALFGASSTKKPNKVEKVAKESAVPKKPSATKGLFEDDDDLFRGQQPEAPSVDLFGPSSPIKQKSNPLAAEVRKEKEPSPPPAADSEPPSKSLLLKGATITASSTDLFGEIEDDGDLFSSPAPAPAPAAKKIDPLKVPGATTTESSSDIGSPTKNEPSAAPPSKSKKPIGGVSLFGGVDMSNALRKGKLSPEVESPEERSKNDLFKGSPTKNEDDLFKPKPKSAFHKPSSEKPTERATPPSVKNSISPRPSNVGKLKMNLAIDPTALLPGAKKPQEEAPAKSVGFEEPAVADTLFSAQKSRAKIQNKRRPPTRRHLQSNATRDSVDNDVLFNSTNNTNNNTDNSLEKNSNDRLANSTRQSSIEKSKLLDDSPGSAAKFNGATSDNSSAADDLFSSSPESAKNSSSASSSSLDSKKNQKTPEDLISGNSKADYSNSHPKNSGISANTGTSERLKQSDDDLFSNISPPKQKVKENSDSKTSKEQDSFDDIFSDSSLLKKSKKKQQQFEDDIFSSIPKKSEKQSAFNDDDIFSSDIAKPKKSKPAAAPLLNDDDIFKGMPAKSVPSKPKPQLQEDEDDIFSSASVKPRRPKKTVTKDDDIFSDNTDIFSDLTTSKTKTSKSSKMASGDSLFRDADMEDIFASAKTTKKSTNSTKKKLDAGESSIFDDPLSALD